mgnify:CR=1 FL=1
MPITLQAAGVAAGATQVPPVHLALGSAQQMPLLGLHRSPFLFLVSQSFAHLPLVQAKVSWQHLHVATWGVRAAERAAQVSLLAQPTMYTERTGLQR